MNHDNRRDVVKKSNKVVKVSYKPNRDEGDISSIFHGIEDLINLASALNFNFYVAADRIEVIGKATGAEFDTAEPYIVIYDQVWMEGRKK